MAQSGAALVLVVLASFVFWADAFPPPKPSEWHLCDKRANYDVVVRNVTINPDPVVSGEEMTIIVPAYTEKEMAKGSVIVSVAFHGVPVHTERIDLCDRLQCPITPGDFVLSNTQVLPGITPPGSYRIRLQFLGEEGDLLACANINFSIVWKKSAVETLESFNPLELHKNAAERAAPVAHT